MRSLTTQKTAKDSAQSQQGRTRSPLSNSEVRSQLIPSLSTGLPMIQRQCACGGGCPRCQENLGVQTKLKISEPGDVYEQEADRIADEVMRMPEPSVQRQVEGKEGEMVQRKTNTPEAAPKLPEIPSSLQTVLQSPSQSLDPKTRDFMETRFGQDFSQVRIYSGTEAQRSAQALNANAYTVGQNIVFGAGQFTPGTTTGKRLLAHELTHVMQQARGNPPLATIQRDDAGGGSTEFQDRVTSRSTSGTGLIEGRVTRTETVPASDSQPQQVIHRGTMNITFDPSECSITIPFGYNFVQADHAANESMGFCDNPPSTTAVPLLPADRFNRLKASVIADVNRGLNGWFDVRLTGGSCPRGCADRLLPIRVAAREDTENPDKTIRVVNRGGRANAGTICAASWERTTAVHEGGHQVLGVGDEYPERDERLRAVAPDWFHPERVRRDYSIMGPEESSRFAMFHERHFNAVKTFLEDVFPGCTATLQARSRPIIPDYRGVFGVGVTSMGGGTSGPFLEFGLRLGLPLDRLRRWEFVLGSQFRYMYASGDERFQEALLLGARLGVEGSTGSAGHGFTAGVFGEAGYGWFSSSDYAPGGAGSRSASMPYGELGIGAGYRTPILGLGRFDFRLEGAVGSTIGAPGVIGPTTRDIETDPERSRWFRLGVSLGMQF